MSLKGRRASRAEAKKTDDTPSAFQHASGFTDLAGVLGEHTIDESQPISKVSPKGYRARSVAKQPSR
jgi:hypothetical protein